MTDQQEICRSPLELVEHALELLLAHDMAGFAGLWAADGVMEFPFAAEGSPRRLEGRPAVTEYLLPYADHVDLRAITSKIVHQTLDPEVVIVEFSVDGVAVRTGGPYRVSYVAVIRVRNGQIVTFRDYWSPIAAAAAFGGQAR